VVGYYQKTTTCIFTAGEISDLATFGLHVGVAMGVHLFLMTLCTSPQHITTINLMTAASTHCFGAQLVPVYNESHVLPLSFFLCVLFRI